MRALVLREPRQASIETVPDPQASEKDFLLRVRMVGFCGSDLNSFPSRYQKTLVSLD